MKKRVVSKSLILRMESIMKSFTKEINPFQKNRLFPKAWVVWENNYLFNKAVFKKYVHFSKQAFVKGKHCF